MAKEALKRSLADRRFLIDDLHAAGEITDGVYEREKNILKHRGADAGLSDVDFDLIDCGEGR
jgi:hypothetical protein